MERFVLDGGLQLGSRHCYVTKKSDCCDDVAAAFDTLLSH